jgi:hypothetical protein
MKGEYKKRIQRFDPKCFASFNVPIAARINDSATNDRLAFLFFAIAEMRSYSLAVQRKLGILSQRWIGLGTAYRGGIGFDGPPVNAEKTERTMKTSQKPGQCAHLPRVCIPPAGEKYCSQFCKEAGSSESEIACDCGHPARTK